MPTECNWTNNNLACVNTWGFLRALKQFKDVFKNAGDLKMSDLRFWSPLDSDEARRTVALGLATQLDNMFALGLRAKYEDGFNRTKATTSMTEVFVQTDATVCELSEAVDDAYSFLGEKM